MRLKWLVLFLLGLFGACWAGDYVIVLHGLGRTEDSMLKLVMALNSAGYQVLNLNYDSRHDPLETLADSLLPKAVAQYCVEPESKINFVTHSLGGIVVRCYLKRHALPNLGRVVMLAPPNRGSDLAAFWSHVWPVSRLLGPNLTKLRTGPESFVNQLGKAEYPVGVIAGTRSYNPFFSLLVGGDDDGKVAVENTRLEGMADFTTVAASHTYLMNSDQAIALTLKFLAQGSFK